MTGSPASRLVCFGCGAEPAPDEPFPFRCPNAGRGDDVDHVLRRELDLGSVAWPAEDPAEASPFVRYRTLLHSHHRWTAAGRDDAEFVDLVGALDDRVAAVDGHGFRTTPFSRAGTLSDRLGFGEGGGVWVKDETGNVSGSHKARHLFGLLLHLEVAERIGAADPEARPDLAIASCGNAALAAAVVAAAGGRRLRVFVPTDADPLVVSRLKELGAHITVCPREDGVPGDPTYHAMRAAIAEGALPFTCQGNENGLAIEGGETLGYEIVDALATAVVAAFAEAAALGAVAERPRVDTVQTQSAWPLRRAFDAVAADLGTEDRETAAPVPGDVAAEAVRRAAGRRSAFMWPWETTPHSLAHGILDDETYDWAAVVEGMLATGGRPAVVGEALLAEANDLAREVTGIDVDPTGSAGLAGLLAARLDDRVPSTDRVAVLFTGVARNG